MPKKKVCLKHYQNTLQLLSHASYNFWTKQKHFICHIETCKCYQTNFDGNIKTFPRNTVIIIFKLGKQNFTFFCYKPCVTHCNSQTFVLGKNGQYLSNSFYDAVPTFRLLECSFHFIESLLVAWRVRCKKFWKVQCRELTYLLM